MDTLKLPKIELHCHLDGSLRPETIIEIAKEEDVLLPTYELEKVKELVIAPAECTSLNDYITRFDIPIAVMQSKKSLERVSYELLADAAKENVKYIEVRFGPNLHTQKGLTLDEVIESVIAGMKRAEKEFDIKGNLILSCLRFMPIEASFELVEAGKKYLGKGVVAIDVAGNEDAGFCEKFIVPIKLAKEYGYRVTIHAGETGIGKNVLEAVQMLEAERIGHGVFINSHEEAYKIVKEKNITLEICPTSNIQTKAVAKVSEHPIYDFYKDGIKVTLNTDNRTVSDIDLTNEFEIVSKEFNLSYEDCVRIYLNSVDASFADETTKDELRKHVMA